MFSVTFFELLEYVVSRSRINGVQILGDAVTIIKDHNSKFKKNENYINLLTAQMAIDKTVLNCLVP